MTRFGPQTHFHAAHVGKVPNGYSGLVFGIEASGAAVTFLSAAACPGFTLGPSSSGEPEAILLCSIDGTCHGWDDHPGYLMYSTTNTCLTWFEVVSSVDYGHNNVINCDNLYDWGTDIGGYARWGSGSTGVEVTTWGKVKALFR